jgi:type VI secretion system protein ImpB
VKEILVPGKSGQKFIGRNRPPRVQIEYDVEVYGAEKKVEIPFVMGVMADLSGKPAEPLPPVADRKFLEIDVDNFDDRLKAMKPRVAFAVPNTLTGEGNLSVDLNFESMDDFSPAAVAQKVDALRKLLDVRTELSNLLSYMDGKTGAEELIGNLLQNPDLLQTLASAPKPEEAEEAAEE